MTTQNVPPFYSQIEFDTASEPLSQSAKLAKRKSRKSRNRSLGGNDPNFNQQWYLHNTGQTGGTPGIDLNVKNVWSDYTGAGVKVGIIDDGVEYTHPELQNNYDGSKDYDTDLKYADGGPLYTNESHGTAVAGIIAAKGNNGIGGKGIAYNASVAGIRMDFNSAIDGQATLAFQKAANFDVVNNSWGYTFAFSDNFADPLYASASSTLQKVAQSGRQGLGTVVVFAAGNGRTEYDNANYHNYQNSRFTIAVAALNHTGTHTYYSTPGANLLVSAFGGDTTTDGIFTTDRSGRTGYAAGDYDPGFNGTSAAAPMISGVVALMLDANPRLGYRDVQEILAYSARQTDTGDASWQINGAKNWNGGGLHTSPDYGFGLVDAQAAVRLAETWGAQSTFANERVVTAQSFPNVTIPDAGSPVTDTITLTSGLNIDRVEVTVDIKHNYIGDLQISLVSPDGTESLLLDRPADYYRRTQGSLNQDDLNFTFSSTQYWGETGVGDWKLVVHDQAAVDTGALSSWSLKIYGDDLTNDNTYVYTNEFANSTDPSRQTLSDALGIDTLNAAAITSNSTIDLTLGATSTLAGKSLTINGIIENAFGGIGSDIIIGNEAPNSFSGGRGLDTLDGRAGDDQLRGEKGDDTLLGGAGNDLLVGHFGNDNLTGGEGQDRFLFASGKAFQAAQMGVDTLVDFVSGIDKIVLDKTLFSDLVSSIGDGFSAAREFATVATDAAARTSAALIVYNQTNGRLFYNANGNLANFGAGGQFATLSTPSPLAQTDFQIRV